MARCLIVGCGCRGRMLAQQLRTDGHVVRGTTRREQELEVLQDAGIEPVLADPDRLATLVPAFDHVGVICLLLGSASGTPAALAALHGPRLETLLFRVIDTTIHGVIYEAAGTADPGLLRSGASIVESACRQSSIPFELLEARPDGGYEAWAAAAGDAVWRIIG